MIGKIIEEEKYYAGIDRVILQGKEKRKSVDLSNVNGILKVSHFQKSKYWILTMLASFAMKGLPCQATWQNLSKELPLSH